MTPREQLIQWAVSANKSAQTVLDELDRFDELQILYNELLYAVHTIHEGETRHETALRYIREREAVKGSAAMETER